MIAKEAGNAKGELYYCINMPRFFRPPNAQDLQWCPLKTSRCTVSLKAYVIAYPQFFCMHFRKFVYDLAHDSNALLVWLIVQEVLSKQHQNNKAIAVAEGTSLTRFMKHHDYHVDLPACLPLCLITLNTD